MALTPGVELAGVRPPLVRELVASQVQRFHVLPRVDRRVNVASRKNNRNHNHNNHNN